MPQCGTTGNAAPLYITFAPMLSVAREKPASGRFAPTPSGPLHLGSLVAAVGSYLAARSSGGTWRVRIDDIDRARVVPGADTQILSALEAHGLRWDGPVIYQSTRVEAYRAALNRLTDKAAAYRCTCTRREIATAAVRGPEGWIYPGTCRTGPTRDRSAHAWRVDLRGPRLTYVDLTLGPVSVDPAHSTGDVVIWRADGVPSYQLSCVVDDADMGVTQVVRGLDLSGSTATQIRLFHLLDLPTPEYAHLPLVLGPNGHKLAKRDKSDGLSERNASANVHRALDFLGMAAPREITSVRDLLAWAVSAFTWTAVSRRTANRSDASSGN